MRPGKGRWGEGHTVAKAKQLAVCFLFQPGVLSQVHLAARCGPGNKRLAGDSAMCQKPGEMQATQLP